MIRKVVNSVITLFLVIIVNFVLFRMMPGNPVNVMVPSDPRIPSEYKQMIIDQYGLDDPMSVQFFRYIWDALTFDFGNSFSNINTPAIDVVMENLRWTLLLAGSSSVLMILIGMSIGILSAWKRGGLFDSGSLTFSLFFYAMPTFWFAMMLVVFFSMEWKLFPPDSALTYGTSFKFNLDSIVDLLRHLVLPVISLTLGTIAEFVLIMRSSLVDVMTEDYITTARAKGLSEMQVLRGHAVPNAMMPMVALIAITLAFVVGGVFQTEYVFNYPGIGWLTIEATYSLDYPILQASFFLIAVVVIIANLVADVVLIYMDPRVRLA
jgi:peptide/nickel transport system permease protein